MDKVSYALGMSIGANLKSSGFNGLNEEVFFAAFKTMFAGEQTDMTMEEAQALLSDYFQQLQAEQAKGLKSAGEEFLAANSAKEGVTTLPSGLQYEVITEGEGEIPTAEDSVVCHYEGTLIDGTKFDSSYDRNEPATFPVGGVIQGWVEALQLMSTGSKWKLYIPYNLAYGEQGAGGAIPPFATLVFTVELLEIVK